MIILRAVPIWLGYGLKKGTVKERRSPVDWRLMCGAFRTATGSNGTVSSASMSWCFLITCCYANDGKGAWNMLKQATPKSLSCCRHVCLSSCPNYDNNHKWMSIVLNVETFFSCWVITLLGEWVPQYSSMQMQMRQPSRICSSENRDLKPWLKLTFWEPSGLSAFDVPSTATKIPSHPVWSAECRDFADFAESWSLQSSSCTEEPQAVSGKRWPPEAASDAQKKQTRPGSVYAWVFSTQKIAKSGRSSTQRGAIFLV